MNSLSLKTRMSLAVSLLVTVVLLLLAMVSLGYFERQFKQTVSGQQFTMVSAMAEEIDSKIKSAHQVIVAIAGRATPELALDNRKAQAFLDDCVDARTVFDNGIILFSPSGTFIAASPSEPLLQGRDYTFRDYVRKTQSTGKPQISAPFFSTQAHHHPIVMFTAPFFSADGKLAGIVAGGIDLLKENFLGKLASIKIGNKGYLFLYSTDRTMIVHPDRTRILRKDVPPGVNRLFDRAIEGFEGSGHTVNSRGLYAVSSFKHLKTANWILGANYPHAEVYAPVKRAKWYLLAALSVVLLISYCIVWWVMGCLTAPLLRFTDHVRGYNASGAEPKPVTITTDDEIGTLGQAFNEMLVAMDRQKTAIREQKEFSERLLLNSAVPTFVLATDHRVIIWNKACEELTGIRADRVLGTTEAWKGFYQEKRPLLADVIIEGNLNTGQNRKSYGSYKKSPFTPDGLQAEGWCLMPRGGKRYLFIDAVPVRNSSGKVVAVIQTIQDISEKRRAREELEFKNVVLSTQQESSLDGILLVDENNDILSCNRRFMELWNIPIELVAAGDDAPVLELVASRVADKELFLARVNHLYEHRQEKSREEILLSDGRVLDRYSTPILGVDGRYFGRVWYFRDVTERKQSEQAMRESEQRYRGLVELFPDAIFVHTKGKLIFANSQGARLLGADTPEVLYGREALDFVHPDSRELVVERIQRAFESGKPNAPIEELFVKLDGSPVPVEVSSVPFEFHGEKALQIIARDITDRRKMQEERLKAQKLESLGILAGGIAHDFNNILTGILGNLSLASARLEQSHPVGRFLRESEKAAARASRLTQQLLTFARGGEPVKKATDAGPLIREVTSFALHGSNVKAVIDITPDLWCIEADSGQISQALHNILVNAVQAMPDGGEVTVCARNEAFDADNTYRLSAGQYIRINIDDSGCGISPENLGKIFDPYFTTKPNGSGLGLASVYSIVKHHGGFVEASSSEGVGSSLTIFLPALPGRRTVERSTGEACIATGTGRILVMDDEKMIRDLAIEMLQFAGYCVESCVDGGAAVEMFRGANGSEQPYDAVILDLTVPGAMGGKEAANLILEIDPNAVLIVSSGYSNDPVIADYRRFGFSGAVSKPFDVGDLTREVARLVRRSR